LNDTIGEHAAVASVADGRGRGFDTAAAVGWNGILDDAAEGIRCTAAATGEGFLETLQEVARGQHHVFLVVKYVVPLLHACVAALDEDLALELVLAPMRVQQLRVLAVDDLVIICMDKQHWRADHLRSVPHKVRPVLPAIQHEEAHAAQDV
jgi:hypothetical protein